MTDEELHAHLIGQQGSRRDLNTPVLIVELDALDRNIARMAAFAEAHGLKLRPHAKTHKSPDIGRRQIAAGAIGLCCAKIGEAEVMADAGLAGLHITSPVVSPPAIARLTALHQRSEGLMCVVDDPANVRALGAAVAAAGDTPLMVIIDIDPGIRRTGVPTPDAAVAVLDAIRAEPSLSYKGVQCYCGLQQHIAGFGERKAAMADRATFVRSVIAALSEAGGAPEIVTGGGTGTHRIDVALDLFTELQVGSYIFMDSQYLACDLTGEDATAGSPFETSLMIDARVVSATGPAMVTLDAGFKAFATDADPPQILHGAPEEAKFFFMGDEHGAVFSMTGTLPGLSDMVTLAAPHCDPTVNLYDTYHVVQGDTLRALWPIAARGRSR
jgi:D-serine deaminase-like pyridoxal phosphate-dependent protein